MFNIEDMMAPIDDTFDFLKIKTGTVDAFASENLENTDEQDSKGKNKWIPSIILIIYINTV